MTLQRRGRYDLLSAATPFRPDTPPPVGRDSGLGGQRRAPEDDRRGPTGQAAASRGESFDGLDGALLLIVRLCHQPAGSRRKRKPR
jgi:hypothetical protein